MAGDVSYIQIMNNNNDETIKEMYIGFTSYLNTY